MQNNAENAKLCPANTHVPSALGNNPNKSETSNSFGEFSDIRSPPSDLLISGIANRDPENPQLIIINA